MDGRGIDGERRKLAINDINQTNIIHILDHRDIANQEREKEIESK